MTSKYQSEMRKLEERPLMNHDAHVQELQDKLAMAQKNSKELKLELDEKDQEFEGRNHIDF